MQVSCFLAFAYLLLRIDTCSTRTKYIDSVVTNTTRSPDQIKLSLASEVIKCSSMLIRSQNTLGRLASGLDTVTGKVFSDVVRD